MGSTAFFARMEVITRRAGPRDVPRMLELVQELAAFERAPNEVTVTEEQMREAGFGNDPVWVGWVAEVEGRVVEAGHRHPATGSPLTCHSSLTTESGSSRRGGGP